MLKKGFFIILQNWQKNDLVRVHIFVKSMKINVLFFILLDHFHSYLQFSWRNLFENHRDLKTALSKSKLFKYSYNRIF